MIGPISNHNLITCGVPQGSILGPLLFILYINDIIETSPLLRFILFADDTNLFYSNAKLALLINTVNAGLDTLAVWFRANKLSLNVSKTNYIIFGRKKLPSIIPDILIDGVRVKRVDSTKFLGVHIDSLSSWKTHISNVCVKLSKSIGAINRVKNLLPPSTLLLLYHTMVYPYLTYNCIVWGGASSTNLNPARVLQKRALRIITNSSYQLPSNPIFHKLNLLKFDDICKFLSLQFIAQFKLNLLPQACSYFFAIADINRRYNTRNVSYFVHQSCKTELRKNSIFIKGPNLWDLLPLTIQNSLCINEFNRTLKKHYIQSYGTV